MSTLPNIEYSIVATEIPERSIEVIAFRFQKANSFTVRLSLIADDAAIHRQLFSVDASKLLHKDINHFPHRNNCYRTVRVTAIVHHLLTYVLNCCL